MPKPVKLHTISESIDDDEILKNIRKLHLFLMPGAIITVHDGKIAAIEELFLKCSKDRTHLTPRSDFLMQKILEEVVEGQPRYLEHFWMKKSKSWMRKSYKREILRDP